MNEQSGVMEITDESFRERLWLVQRGVPYDLAKNMAAEDVLAHVVVLGEMEGNEFDWDKMQWRTKVKFVERSFEVDGADILARVSTAVSRSDEASK